MITVIIHGQQHKGSTYHLAHLLAEKLGLKTKGFFTLMHMLQKRGWNPADVQYWQEKGWNGKNRPWKNEKTGGSP